MEPNIISLTSDFGLKDPYVAEMKAIILSICPNAAIVDVTHNVEKFSVREGAFVLASAAPYFPDKSVHVAVVDPTVGTQRRPIIIQTGNAYFVGPDNGLLILAAKAQIIKQIRKIESRRFMLAHVSPTFHGRDIFAPAAAHLLNGVAIEEFGPKITDFIEPPFSKVTRDKNNLEGVILHVDDFGNLITNLHVKDVAAFQGPMVQVLIDSQMEQMKFVKTYADAKFNEPVALIGGHNYLEIGLNQGNAAAKFSVKAGDKITLSRF